MSTKPSISYLLDILQHFDIVKYFNNECFEKHQIQNLLLNTYMLQFSKLVLTMPTIIDFCGQL
jgi:ABC-type transport system involved in Fe-S cluster assembly fused permease/ATPase subunit